jgi:hypothetical protein
MSNQENLKKKRGCHENFLSKSEREEKGTWPENGYQRMWSDKNSWSITRRRRAQNPYYKIYKPALISGYPKGGDSFSAGSFMAIIPSMVNRQTFAGIPLRPLSLPSLSNPISSNQPQSFWPNPIHLKA